MSIIQGTSKSSAAGYTIDQSIRFNDNDSAKLTRTPSGAGNRKKFTISWWMKLALADVSANDFLFCSYSAANDFFGVVLQRDDATFNSELYFQSQVANVNVISKMTAQVFRDPSAWYHCVLVIDTDNGTAEDRNILYVNGTRITNWHPTYNTNSSSGHTTYWNNTNAHTISSFNSTAYYDGYMAEIYNIDGQALNASSFGEVNSDTGQWVPIKYTGSATGNSFHITGEDSANLGADYSGNGNDFTSSGLTSADQVTDSPTDNWSTWNPTSGTWIYPATFSDGNLTAIKSGSGTNIVGSTISFPATGNWYAEFTIDATGSSSYVWQVGIIEVDDAERFDTVEPRLGSGAKGYAYTTNWSGSPVPSKQNNNSAVSYGTLGTATDVIGVHLNNGTLVFYHNNVSQGTAYSGITGEYIFAWSGQGGAQVTANFGQKGFTYTPPTGALAVTTANLPDPTIALPGENFNTVTWTATGATNSITGVGFQPDFIWGKKRTPTADNHGLVDVVRGNTKQVASNLGDAEFTNTNGVQSFDADGFTLAGSGAGSGVWNGNAGATHVAWCWKADNTSGSSNTDGSITSTVSANTTSGFSVATYSGTGSTATVGHGLGAAPSMIIIKRRDTTGGWIVYHSAIGATKYLYLNTTDIAITSSTPFNNTEPTSSVFTVGSANETNNGSGTYVAYSFAEVDGFSKAGSYVTNASTDGPFVYCGFRPAWVIFFMIAGSGAGRSILDSVRDPYNPEDSILQANTSAVESSGSSYYTDFLSNGFKLRTSSDFNGSGRTVAYMAFAESPFKYANAR